MRMLLDKIFCLDQDTQNNLMFVKLKSSSSFDYSVVVVSSLSLPLSLSHQKVVIRIGYMTTSDIQHQCSSQHSDD